MLQGRLPKEALEADPILIYPGAVFYLAVLDGLRSRAIEVDVRLIHPDITVLSVVHRNAVSKFERPDGLERAKP